MLGGDREQLSTSYFVYCLLQCHKQKILKTLFSDDFSKGKMTKQLAFKERKQQLWLIPIKNLIWGAEWVILIIDQDLVPGELPDDLTEVP